MPRRVTEVLAEAVVLNQPKKRVTEALVEAVVRNQPEQSVTVVLVRSCAAWPTSRRSPMRIRSSWS